MFERGEELLWEPGRTSKYSRDCSPKIVVCLSSHPNPVQGTSRVFMPEFEVVATVRNTRLKRLKHEEKIKRLYPPKSDILPRGICCVGEGN